jgi:hypothetical protein
MTKEQSNKINDLIDRMHGLLSDLGESAIFPVICYSFPRYAEIVPC